MPYYRFVCPSCCHELTRHFTMAAVGEAKVICIECGATMHQLYSPPTIINYRSGAELAERALRGEETVPGMTRQESMATAAQMARDRRRPGL